VQPPPSCHHLTPSLARSLAGWQAGEVCEVFSRGFIPDLFINVNVQEREERRFKGGWTQEQKLSPRPHNSREV